MSNKPEEEEDPYALFRAAAAGAKRLRQDTIAPAPKPPRPQRSQQGESEPAPPPFFFSEDYEPLRDSNGVYRRLNAPADLVARAQRGELPPELLLDLHGLDRETVKLELAALLARCQQRHYDSALVICGRGHGILIDKVPAYLAQHPAVAAVLPAPRRHGGKHAFLVVIENPESLWQRR